MKNTKYNAVQQLQKSGLSFTRREYWTKLRGDYASNTLLYPLCMLKKK